MLRSNRFAVFAWFRSSRRNNNLLAARSACLRCCFLLRARRMASLGAKWAAEYRGRVASAHIMRAA